ncbi:hypothetical protein, partial [Pseudomonas aeruginosa]
MPISLGPPQFLRTRTPPMFLRRLSIQWKITLLAGLCLLGVVALLVG